MVQKHKKRQKKKHEQFNKNENGDKNNENEKNDRNNVNKSGKDLMIENRLPSLITIGNDWKNGKDEKNRNRNNSVWRNKNKISIFPSTMKNDSNNGNNGSNENKENSENNGDNNDVIVTARHRQACIIS